MTAASFAGALTGNADTATALAANPSDCSANQFATTIAANGNLTCASLTDGDIPNSITVDLATAATALASNPTDCSANQFANAIAASGALTCAGITDADVSDTLTSSLFVGSGSTTSAIDLATAEVAGNLKASSLQNAAADLGAANVTIDLTNTNGSFVTNLTLDGTVTAGNLTSAGAITFSGLSTAGIVTNTAGGVLGTVATLPVGNGGTGIASYVVGDILYASGTTALSRLADVGTGSCLISGGVGVAPSWGSCSGSGGSYITNGVAQQTSANINIQSLASNVALVVQGAAGQNVANFVSSGGSTVVSFSSAGAITAVGIDAGIGLIQGTGGSTITGAAISLNDTSNFATNINTGTSTGAVNIGNSLAGAVNIQSAGSITLVGGGASSLKTANNGSGASASVTIASGTGTTSTGAISITSGNASAGASGGVTIDSGTASGTRGSVLIGTGLTNHNVTIGNGSSGSTAIVQGGGSSGGVSIQTTGNGTINIATDNYLNTVQIGNTANAIAQTINIGNNTTASSSNTVTIGSLVGTSPLKLQGGTTGVIVQAVGASGTGFEVRDQYSNKLLVADTSGVNLYVGDPSANNFAVQLVLDTKNTTGDPTGINGGQYYNSFLNKFRCYENGAWANCIGAGGGGGDLQAAYGLGNAITTTDARNLSVGLADTATDSNFLVNIASGSTSKFAVQNAGSDVLSANSNTVSIQGTGGLALGVSNSIDGSLTLADSLSSNTLTIQSAANMSGSYTVYVPSASSADEFCLRYANNCSGSFIYNDTSLRTNSNINIQGTSGSVSLAVKGAGSMNIAQFRDSSNNMVARIEDQGAIWFQNSADSASALRVNNSAGTALLTVDTLNSKTTINSNLLIGAQADATAHNFASGCSCMTNGTAGTFGSDASRDAVVSSVVFKGKLFISTREADLGGVYRYDGGGTWTLVTNAVGKAVAGDTANIDSFVLNVFNGALYIGSQGTPNTAGLYSSTTADTTADSFALVNATRGSFGLSQTAIDGVQDLAVWNGNLVLSTTEPNLAEVGRYDGGTTFVQINATDGKLVAEATADVDGFNFTVYGGKLFLGTITGALTARVGVHAGVGTTIVALNATLGTFGANASMIDVTSMQVYNGELYVAVSNTNGAGIYRWLPEVNSVSTTVTNWNLVTNAVGKVVAGDTANIDSFTLKNYNGRLYAGSQTAAAEDTAGLYEYDGTKGNWSLINTTRGTFGAQTGVNAISSIQSLSGVLYVGTDEGTNNVGSVYTWSKTEQNSYGLQFDSGSNNLGKLSFVGDNQPNDSGGHFGSFLFSHAIKLEAGAFDYAEDYSTLDSTLSPGEPVSVDPDHPEQVRRAQAGDTILGVVSESPGFRLSASEPPADGGRWIPIALVGRVPVKVSTDNGSVPVMAGDKLSISDTPGILHRAKPGEQVAGVALASYTAANVGSVSLFVHPEWNSEGTSIAGISQNDITLRSISSEKSEIFKVLDQAGNSVASIDNHGNANFKGTITADKIKANQIEGLEIYTDQLSSLKQKVNDVSSQVAANDAGANSGGAVLGASTPAVSSVPASLNMNIKGGLDVSGDAQFHGNVLFYKLVTYVEKTIFNNDVTFAAHIQTEGAAPTITAVAGDAAATSTVDGNDNSGQITSNLTQDSTSGQTISVNFAKPYAKAPRVLLTPTNESSAQLKYYVKSTPNGYKIFFAQDQPAGTQLEFNYLVVQ